MIDITVGIMSYNRPQFLDEAIASVLSQTVTPKKIIIFDNGSELEVLSVAQKYFSDGVEWVGSQKNNGFFWNFERAIELCTTKYLMLLHDDDRLLKNFLEKQMELLTSNPDIAALSCNGYLISAEGVQYGVTLFPFNARSSLEFFRTPGQVGIKYASNSCVPLSPAIYNTKSLLNSKIKEEFGKVADAVFFCELAQSGTVAVNNFPLYEMRFHLEQDSQHIPFHLSQLLEDFFWSVSCKDITETKLLRVQLIRQHSIRNLRLVVERIKILDFQAIPSLLLDKRFNWISALRSTIRYCLGDCMLKLGNSKKSFKIL
ncbi:glycosyltransferase family 2 protein [Polynucleobacter paneuropaeus]|nr:glycosyltransferase family 2 protein [Polynucleobacter paneuropaeus]